LLIIEVKKVPIIRIEKPVLSLIFSFYRNKTHPMIGNSKHKAYYQWLLVSISFEVANVFAQLSLFLLGKQ
jgi:hypothetical protein